MNLFEGLEALGFGGIINDDIFAKNNPKDKGPAKKKDAPAMQPADFLYKKQYVCKVCELDFQETTLKQAKIRYVSSETDLKPHYEPLEPLYYDIIMCPSCGYTSLLSLFDKLSTRQAEMIKQQITPKFKKKDYPLVLTVDMAIERYKLALLNAVAKSAKSGEKSYLCLKLAWLHRDKGDKQTEHVFLKNAYRGFVEAYSAENFPIVGLDEPTVAYLIGELARRMGDYNEANKWIGSVIVSKGINPRLKSRAIDVKELIRADVNHASQRP